MPGTPLSILIQQGQQRSGPVPATILLFSTNIPANGGGNTGFSTAPFQLTEKGMFQVDYDPWNTNNPGTVTFQSCLTVGGTYATELTLTQTTVDTATYYYLPQAKVNFFFKFVTTVGAKGLKVSMFDPEPDL